MWKKVFIVIVALIVVGAGTSTLLADAKIDTLTDNFNDNSLDGTKWGKYYYGGEERVAETNSQLELSVPPNLADNDATIYSQANFDLTSSAASVNIKQVAEPNTDTVFELISPGGERDRLMILVAPGYIYASVQYGYTPIAEANASVTVNSDLYVRIREASGTTYFEYSENAGSSWTTLLTYATASIDFGVTSIQALLVAYEWGSGATTENTSIFDNFNILPTPTSATAQSDDDVIFW